MTGLLRSVLSTSQSFPAGLASPPQCANAACPRPQTLWARWRVRHDGVQFRNGWYCSPECFETALASCLHILVRTPWAKTLPTHRLPLGLVLLSQGLINQDQLRQALRSQRLSPGTKKKLGEWLVSQGAVSEQDITRALAIQHGCPVFPVHHAEPLRNALFPIPLMHFYRAVPVTYSPARSILYIGFLEGVNRGFLTALEQMLRCHAEPCMVSPRSYRDLLEQQSSRPGDVVAFDQGLSVLDMSRTISNYAQKTGTESCELSRCENTLWTRLKGRNQWQMDFLVRLKDPDSFSAQAEETAASIQDRPVACR